MSKGTSSSRSCSVLAGVFTPPLGRPRLPSQRITRENAVCSAGIAWQPVRMFRELTAERERERRRPAAQQGGVDFAHHCLYGEADAVAGTGEELFSTPLYAICCSSLNGDNLICRDNK